MGDHHDHHDHEHKHGVRELPDFPTEITFKVICKNLGHIEGRLRSVMSGFDLQADIGGRTSRKSTFISYTVTAVFPSDEVLQRALEMISAIDGVMTMF